MKSIFISLSKQTIKCLSLLSVFWYLTVSVNAQTPVPVFIRNFRVVGTANHVVNGEVVPYPGAPVLLRTETFLANAGYPWVQMHRESIVLTADSNGQVETTIPCYRDASGLFTPVMNAYGRIIGGPPYDSGGGGGFTCNETREVILIRLWTKKDSFEKQN